MTQLQELVVPLTLDNKNFVSGIEGSITKATAFGNVIGNIATAAIGGGLRLLGNGIKAVTGFLSDSVFEAAASQEAIAQLDAVLESTNGIAGVTREQALSLANAFQNVTKYSDESVLSAQSMLLTFTSIGKDVFPQALETVLDMSTALGQDLKSSAIQLGKALNDPITGVTALRRVGVQFNDEQEETIKKLVEEGNLLEAQKMILQELSIEFGGSAKAAGDTFAGKLEILKNKLSDVKETIGNALLPVLSSLGDELIKAIDSEEFQEALGVIAEKLGDLGDWIIENLPRWSEEFTRFATDSVGAIDGIDWATAGNNFGQGILSIFGIGRMKAEEGTRSMGQAIADGIRKFLREAMMMDEWENFIEGVAEWGKNLNDTLQSWFSRIGSNVLNKIKEWGLKWVSELGRIIRLLIEQVQKALNVFRTLPFSGSSSSNSGASGARASGGPVIAGQSYKVAEFYRPEVFTPNTSGRVDKLEKDSDTSKSIDYSLLARMFAIELSKVIN